MENLFSSKVKIDIVSELLEPSFKNDIKTNLKLKKIFKNFGLMFEITSKFFVGVSSIISFASGIYKEPILSFLAGSTSVISLVLLQYSSYSYRESKKISSEINANILKLNNRGEIENNGIENKTINEDSLSDQGTVHETPYSQDTNTPPSLVNKSLSKIKV